jgi:hypothetical protein
MEMIIYYLLCLLARKKLFINVSYFIGTIAFISLSYNTGKNLLYKNLWNNVKTFSVDL